jgi:2,3-bisphosphoglycerate-dependent phosphoglycerate mutase
MKVPGTESLKDTVERVVPFWLESILPEVQKGSQVLVAAHGNSLRSLVKHLDGLSEQQVLGLNIPTGVPLVYELDTYGNKINSYYLLDQHELDAKIQAVAN